MMDCLPGREVVRQQAPSTATTHDVEDGLKDLAQGVHPGAPRRFRGREMGLYVGPFGIGEVGLVCSSHARYSTELLPPDTFSDGFIDGVLRSSLATRFRIGYRNARETVAG